MAYPAVRSQTDSASPSAAIAGSAWRAALRHLAVRWSPQRKDGIATRCRKAQATSAGAAVLPGSPIGFRGTCGGRGVVVAGRDSTGSRSRKSLRMSSGGFARADLEAGAGRGTPGGCVGRSGRERGKGRRWRGKARTACCGGRIELAGRSGGLRKIGLRRGGERRSKATDGWNWDWDSRIRGLVGGGLESVDSLASASSSRRWCYRVRGTVC